MSKVVVDHFFSKKYQHLTVSHINGLLIILLVLAFALVGVKDWNRRIRRDYQNIEAAVDDAKIRGEKLLLEKSTLLAHGALENLAKDQFHLHFPSSQERQVMVLTQKEEQ